MKQLFVLLFLCAACTESRLKNPLPIERIFDSPKLEGDLPKNIKFSPDGERLAFLKGKKENFLVLDLWEWDLTTNTPKLLVNSDDILKGAVEKLSDEEKARRERQRLFDAGIVDYFWSEKGDRLLFPLNGDLYLYDIAAKSFSRLTSSKEFELDPQFSPHGNYVSFVRNDNLFVINLKTKKESQLTGFGSKLKPVGVAEFIAQEEMDRDHGYWWSPDESTIAFTQIDESQVNVEKRFEIYANDFKVIEQRYPKAGTPNAKIALGVVGVNSKNVKWIPLAKNDFYLADVKWLPQEQGLNLSYQLISRDQQVFGLWLYNVNSAKVATVLQEEDPQWVKIHHEIRFLKNQKSFVWISEKSGFSHLTISDLEGKTKLTLTSGDWSVLSIKAVDEKDGRVYFTANAENALEEHLYKVPLDKVEAPVRITKSRGNHDVQVGAKLFVDSASNIDQPPSVAVYDFKGDKKGDVQKNEVAGDHPLVPFKADFSKWEFNQVSLENGTMLHYRILKPKDFSASKKYPLIQYVYGGPTVQNVRNIWGKNWNFLFQVLAQKGFMVLVADNRGTPNRGHDFERGLKDQFGKIDVQDQLYVLSKVIDLGSVDEKRIGVFGHSYGGYLTLMMMGQGISPWKYKVGISGAPVVDWRIYDTFYTERYLRQPQLNNTAYDQANVLNHLDHLQGNLLLIHGMADDNVLYLNSIQLYEALQKRGKMFDVMPYPGAKHSLAGKETGTHHYKTIVDYFLKNL